MLKELKHPELLFQMAMNSIVGAAMGLFIGLIYGLIIQKLTIYFSPIEMEGPWQVSIFFGMGFGSIIGGVLGGIVGIKK